MFAFTPNHNDCLSHLRKYNEDLSRLKIDGITVPLTNDFIIPSTINTIGTNAFKDCKELVNVAIPDTVTKIGKGAFKNCSNLKSINIPLSVRSIDKSAFKGCKNLNCIKYSSRIYCSVEGFMRDFELDKGGCVIV